MIRWLYSWEDEVDRVTGYWNEKLKHLVEENFLEDLMLFSGLKRQI